MYAHKSFLMLGPDTGTDIMSLIKGGYEIQECTFSFQQGIDRKGKATTRVYGGTFKVTLPQLPPPDITEWAVKSRKYRDGIIVMVDEENLPAEKILFSNAFCVHFEMNYTQTGKSYVSTKLVIQAEKITVADDVYFNNEWSH